MEKRTVADMRSVGGSKGTDEAVIIRTATYSILCVRLSLKPLMNLQKFISKEGERRVHLLDIMMGWKGNIFDSVGGEKFRSI